MFDELRTGWHYYLQASPQLWSRLRGYGLFAGGIIVLWGILFGLSLAFRNPAVTLFLVGFGVFQTMIACRFFKKQVFSVLDANYRAVLASLIADETVPFTRFQIRFARKKVVQKFGNRERICDASGSIQRSLSEILPSLSLSKKQSFLFQKINSLIFQYAADLLISHSFLKKEEPIWNNLQEGMILYMQNFKKIFKMSRHLALLALSFSLAVFMILLPPVLGLSWFLPGLQLYFFLSAVVMSWAFKKIFLDPYAAATLVSEFRKTTKGQSPDPQWDKRLASLSASFFEIRKKAEYCEQSNMRFMNSIVTTDCASFSEGK